MNGKWILWLQEKTIIVAASKNRLDIIAALRILLQHHDSTKQSGRQFLADAIGEGRVRYRRVRSNSLLAFVNRYFLWKNALAQ